VPRLSAAQASPGVISPNKTSSKAPLPAQTDSGIRLGRARMSKIVNAAIIQTRTWGIREKNPVL